LHENSTLAPSVEFKFVGGESAVQNGAAIHHIDKKCRIFKFQDEI